MVCLSDDLVGIYIVPFLGVFAEVQKMNINFVMSVRPSVRLEQLGSHWMDFDEI
jgi:hypothetical protein